MKRYACKFCEKDFSSSTSLTIHDKEHEGEDSTCALCPETFVSNFGPANNGITHSDENQYTCDVCHGRFGQSNYLQQHANIHPGDKPFSGYSLKSHVTAHQKTYSRKSVVCALCHRIFLKRRSLRQHLLPCYKEHMTPPLPTFNKKTLS